MPLEFEFSEPFVNRLTPRHYRVVIFMLPVPSATKTSTKASFVLQDVVLKLKGKLGFFAFEPEMGKNLREEANGFLATYRPLVWITMLWILPSLPVNAASVLGAEFSRYSGVDHSKEYGELVGNCSVLVANAANMDTALTIKDSGDVKRLKHNDLGALDGMSAKSGEVQNGQSRAKQERNAPGVCNEHGLTPKGKMCSELGRNVETVTETITGHELILTHELTTLQHGFPEGVRRPEPVLQGDGLDADSESGRQGSSHPHAHELRLHEPDAPGRHHRLVLIPGL